jgi:hypothetical protein
MNKNTFKFFTGTLKAVKEDNARYIVGIASSTSIDRDNDRMSKDALHTMKATAESNLTIFTNHEYRVPDDLFGNVVDAEIHAKKDAEPIVIKSDDDEVSVVTYDPTDFQIKVKVVSDEVNPKAGQIYKAIEEGLNLGFSIGGAVRKVSRVVDDVTQKAFNLIEAIDLYEISIVGIPSNVDAMNLAISKSLKGVQAPEISKEEIVEILTKAKEIASEPKITDEAVLKHYVKILKSMYDDEYCYDCVQEPTEEQKEEWAEEDRQWAKAQAENALMAVSEAVSVSKYDDDVIHLRSHASEMQYALMIGADTTALAAHIQEHLTQLEKVMKADAKEEENKSPYQMS